MIDMYFFTFMFVFNIMNAGALIILEYVLGITNNIDKNGVINPTSKGGGLEMQVSKPE